MEISELILKLRTEQPCFILRKVIEISGKVSKVNKIWKVSPLIPPEVISPYSLPKPRKFEQEKVMFSIFPNGIQFFLSFLISIYFHSNKP